MSGQGDAPRGRQKPGCEVWQPQQPRRGSAPAAGHPLPAAESGAAMAAKPGVARGVPSRLPHTSAPRGAVTTRISEHPAAAKGTSQPCVPKHRPGGLGKACGGDPGDHQQWILHGCYSHSASRAGCGQSHPTPRWPVLAPSSSVCREPCMALPGHGSQAQHPPLPGPLTPVGVRKTPAPGQPSGCPPPQPWKAGMAQSPAAPATAWQGVGLSIKDARGTNQGDAWHQPAWHPSAPRLLSASPTAPKSPIAHVRGNTQTRGAQEKENPTLP